MQAICEGEVVEGEKRHRQHQKVHSKTADRRVHEGARDVESREEAFGLSFSVSKEIPPIPSACKNWEVDERAQLISQFASVPGDCLAEGQSRRFLSKSQTQKEGAPEGVALVPGNFTTLSVLTDLARRPLW